MSATTGTELLRSGEAMDLIASEKDPITRALLANANFWFLKQYFEQGKQPAADLDYGFVIELLRNVFREHDVLRRILAGEKVGQFFESEERDLEFGIQLVKSDPPELKLHGLLDVTTAPRLQSCIYDIISVPHHSTSLAFNCERLAVVNPWVIAIVWSFAEDVRQAGIRAEVRGFDSSWQAYFETFAEAYARRDPSHDAFLRNLFSAFAKISTRHKQHE